MSTISGGSLQLIKPNIAVCIIMGHCSHVTVGKLGSILIIAACV